MSRRTACNKRLRSSFLDVTEKKGTLRCYRRACPDARVRTTLDRSCIHPNHKAHSLSSLSRPFQLVPSLSLPVFLSPRVSQCRKRDASFKMKLCCLCGIERALIKRPKTGQTICRSCFFQVFEEEIHGTITKSQLFRRGDRVAIAVSGGKDSTVLAYTMKALNERYDYGLDLFLLSVDEGIRGYRDDSLESVKRNQQEYGLPLTIVSYASLYSGWSMDAIVEKIGLKNNCTYCGVFRRQALDRAAMKLKADCIVTGHNADDMAETVLMNLLRGDIARLGRCTAIKTLEANEYTIPRSKPFKYTYEKEIVM